MAKLSSSYSHKALVPKLRFDEFYDEWVIKLLAHYLIENLDHNKFGKYNKTDVLSVSGEYGVVNQIKLQGRSFAGQSVLPYHIVYTNDIVYTKSPLKSSPYGIIKVNKGVVGIVSTLYAVYHPQQNVVPDFIDYYFQNHKRLNKYLKPLVNIGAKHDMKINNQVALSGEVCFPTMVEQQKIVDFLNVLDKRITLQQKLIDNLKSYKRGVFSRLYDVFLESVCEVKLCDIVECLDSQRIPINSSERSKRKGIYPYYGANGVQDYIDHYIFDGEFVLLAEDGGHFDDFNENAIAQYVIGKIWVNNHAHILQTKKCITKFLYFMLEHKDIRSYINGTSRSKLNQEDMFQISIPLPTDAVQTRIVTLLSGIDNTIISAENTYKKLVEYKNGLLQKLFI